MNFRFIEERGLEFIVLSNKIHERLINSDRLDMKILIDNLKI